MNEQSQKIERMTVRFSTDDMRLIEQLAEKDNRTPANLVAHIVLCYLEKQSGGLE